MYRNNKYYFFVSKALLTIWFLRITYDNSYNRFSPCRFAICFFFACRWRHTRLQGDWSSDVCSSDLPLPAPYRRSACYSIRPASRAELRTSTTDSVLSVIRLFSQRLRFLALRLRVPAIRFGLLPRRFLIVIRHSVLQLASGRLHAIG